MDERRARETLQQFRTGEPPTPAELERMARVAIRASRPRGRSTVLSTRSRAGLAVGAAAVAGLAALGLVLAPWGLRDHLTRPASAHVSPGTWSWKDATVPGSPLTADPALQEAVRKAGVLPGRVRGVETSAGRSGVTLVAAAGKSGQTCFALRAAGAIGPFACLGRFDSRALLHFWSRERVAHPLVVGIARSDVVRVVATFAGGSERALPLNRWRAFSHRAHGPEPVLMRLTVYDGTGVTLDEVSLLEAGWLAA